MLGSSWVNTRNLQTNQTNSSRYNQHELVQFSEEHLAEFAKWDLCLHQSSLTIKIWARIRVDNFVRQCEDRAEREWEHEFYPSDDDPDPQDDDPDPVDDGSGWWNGDDWQIFCHQERCSFLILIFFIPSSSSTITILSPILPLIQYHQHNHIHIH